RFHGHTPGRASVLTVQRDKFRRRVVRVAAAEEERAAADGRRERLRVAREEGPPRLESPRLGRAAAAACEADGETDSDDSSLTTARSHGPLRSMTRPAVYASRIAG